MSNLKVLMLRSSTGVFGAEQVMLEIAKGVKELGITPVVGVLENSSDEWPALARRSRELNLETVEFHCRGAFDRQTISTIREYVKSEDIPLIHSHGYRSNFYSLLSAGANKAHCLATCYPWTNTDNGLKSKFSSFLNKTWLRKMDQIVAVSDEVGE